jgi:hypothetical protein
MLLAEANLSRLANALGRVDADLKGPRLTMTKKGTVRAVPAALCAV